MVVSTFGIETNIHAISLTSTSRNSCGSFYRTRHSLMGSGPKATGILAKPILLKWLTYLGHLHKNCWIGQTAQYTLAYTMRKVCRILQVCLRSQGEFSYSKLIPSPAIMFSNSTPFLQGEDKRLFIEFASKMLRWLPEERSTAKDLYNDPWLTFKARDWLEE